MDESERERLTKKLHAACANATYANNHWPLCQKVSAAIAEARCDRLRPRRER